MINITSREKREYMTSLMRKRSIIALCSGIIELVLVFYALLQGYYKTTAVCGEDIFASYMYFTMITNTLAGISVAFVIPFAVEGIRYRRFTLPRWVSVMLFTSVNSITIVMVTVLGFLGRVAPEDAFGYGGIFTHIVCPILVIILFFQIEGGCRFTIKDCLFSCLPVTIYMAVYYVMVVIIGSENGGWRDIYYITDHLQPVLAVILGLIVAFSMSFILSRLSNYLSKRRKERAFRYWDKDVEPIEASIEAYGLGVAMAQNTNRERIWIPYEILEELACRYDLEASDLVKAFVKGLEVNM